MAPRAVRALRSRVRELAENWGTFFLPAILAGERMTADVVAGSPSLRFVGEQMRDVTGRALIPLGENPGRYHSEGECDGQRRDLPAHEEKSNERCPGTAASGIPNIITIRNQFHWFWFARIVGNSVGSNATDQTNKRGRGNDLDSTFERHPLPCRGA